MHFVGKDIYEKNQLYNSKYNLNIYSGGANFFNHPRWNEALGIVEGIPVVEGIQVVEGIPVNTDIEESNYIVILRDGEHFESFTKKDLSKMVLFSEEALKIINDLIEKKRVESPFPFQSYMTIDEIIAILISKRRIGGNNKRTI